MLETTGLSIAEIARQSGFEDVSVFRRHFRGYAGLSPTAYRRGFGQAAPGSGKGLSPRCGEAAEPLI